MPVDGSAVALPLLAAPSKISTCSPLLALPVSFTVVSTVVPRSGITVPLESWALVMVGATTAVTVSVRAPEV